MKPQDSPGRAAARPGDVLVLGMHRSGTSMVTRLIAALGASPGDSADLIPRDARDNPSGYWERRDVVFEHDSLLASAGFGWDWLAGFDPRRLPDAHRSAFMARARQWRAGLDTGSLPLVLKDPRLCLLLPLWQAVLDAPVCVVCVRDPRAIATSVATPPRHRYPAPFALALWEKYLQQALLALRGRRALFVSYEALLADPAAQVRRLAAGLATLGSLHTLAPRAERIEGARIEGDLVDARLNRAAAATRARLSTAQTALYEWLRAACGAPAPLTVTGLPLFGDADTTLAWFQTHQRERIWQAPAPVPAPAQAVVA